MATNVEEISEGLARVVEAAAPWVVRVEGRRRRPSTGILWSRDGLVVTAHHAVERDEGLRVSLDGEATAPAELVGRDPATDVAVLKVAGGGRDLAAEDAGPLKVGHLLLALGRPGRTVRATLGIVSAVAEGWKNPAGARLQTYVEADAALGRGFSGGPVFDAAGRFAGLATSGLVSQATMIIPPKSLRQVVEAVVAQGGIRRGYLGVGSHPIRLQGRAKDAAGAEVGLLVFSVEPDGPADKGGLLVGDVLLALDGQPVGHIEDLLGALSADRAGKPASLRALRAGAPLDLTVTVGERR